MYRYTKSCKQHQVMSGIVTIFNR